MQLYANYCYSKFFFLLDISIKVPNYLVAIIYWLHQYYSARLEYILVVFRIVVASRSSYSVLLELSKGECCLYLVD